MSEHVVIENIQRVFTQGARELRAARCQPFSGGRRGCRTGWAVRLRQIEPAAYCRVVGKARCRGDFLRGTPVDTDNDSRRTEERLRHIGFVYQFHNLLPEFTAQENIALAGRLAGQGRNKSLQSALEAMERLGLADAPPICRRNYRAVSNSVLPLRGHWPINPVLFWLMNRRAVSTGHRVRRSLTYCSKKPRHKMLPFCWQRMIWNWPHAPTALCVCAMVSSILIE